MRVKALLFTLVLGLLAGSALAAGTIKIGGLFDLSGKAQNIGEPTKRVAQMVVDRINKTGGVNGKKIELVIADTESEPGKAVVALNRLIAKDKVVAVIGPTTTGATMACLSTIERAQIPMIACAGGDAPVVPVHKWIFKSPQRTTTAVEVLFAYLKSKGMTRVALLCASDKFGQEGEAALKELASNYGIKIVAEESFDPTDVDMSVQLAKVAKSKPKAVVVWTIGPAGAIIAKNAADANIEIPLFQCHGQPDDNYLKLGGKAVEGTMMPATKLVVGVQLAMADKQRSGILRFSKMYTQNKIGVIGTHSGYAWDAVQILVNALKTAGTDADALRTAIEHTKGYVGVSGVYNMSPKDHCGLGANSMVMVTVKNGKWAIEQ